MIDSHAHIDAEVFDADRNDMLARAWSVGMQAIIIPSIEPGGFDKLQALVDSDPRLYRGIGIHPHNVALAGESDLQRVETESRLTRVVAIGEIGSRYEAVAIRLGIYIYGDEVTIHDHFVRRDLSCRM